MRLFTAIELGADVCARAAALVDTLRRRAAASAPQAKITWVAPHRMHLTLRFIGEVDDQRAESILAALRAPVTIEPFDVRWERLGSFPPRGAPRVLWAGVASGHAELARAERAVSERLAAVGIPPEDRSYSPHLTLARVREPAGLKAAPLFEGLDGTLGETRVNAITLFRSHLSPKGPAYIAMQHTPLGSAS